MLFGILHRYVMDQVLRSFLLALTALTGIIVLFMVMAEATRQGLPPQLVIRLVPYIVPGTMPYTAPVALLFAVSVVYGRLAGDNEVVAVKASGLSAWVLLGPSMILGAIIALALIGLSGQIIPRANHVFKTALFKDYETMFYTVLKREREWNNPHWPFFIGVKDIQGKLLVNPTFKHRTPGAGNPNTYDYTVQADLARVRFDEKQAKLFVQLKNALGQGGTQFTSAPLLEFSYPLPAGGYSSANIAKPVQEMTSPEIAMEYVKTRKLLSTEKARQAIAASLWLGSGRMDRIDWPTLLDVARNDASWQAQAFKLLTERWMRNALACSVFFFVALGAPVGMLFAKRDFLSAFITCFLPIILIYYPLVLAGINMSKEGIVPPVVVWGGNLVLAVLASTLALPPVLKH